MNAYVDGVPTPVISFEFTAPLRLDDDIKFKFNSEVALTSCTCRLFCYSSSIRIRGRVMSMSRSSNGILNTEYEACIRR